MNFKMELLKKFIVVELNQLQGEDKTFKIKRIARKTLTDIYNQVPVSAPSESEWDVVLASPSFSVQQTQGAREVAQ